MICVMISIRTGFASRVGVLAWCQRMLRGHAFDSGSLFDEELVADEAAMLNDAAQDYWRQQLYPLKPEYCSVTYGAGGSTQDGTIQTVRAILAEGFKAIPQRDAEDYGELAELVRRTTEIYFPQGAHHG